MSKEFSDFMTNRCELINKARIEDIEVDCPTCKPNKFYVEPGWFDTDEPYYNEKTCEFSIIFNSKLTLSQILSSHESVNHYIEAGDLDWDPKSFPMRATIYGLKKIASFYNKRSDDQYLCAYPGCIATSADVEKYKETMADILDAVEGKSWGKFFETVGLFGLGAMFVNPVTAPLTLLTIISGGLIDLARQAGDALTEEEAKLIEAKVADALKGRSVAQVRQMYQQFSQAPNDQALEWAAHYDWIHDGFYDTPVRIKVSIGKEYIDKLPDIVPEDAQEEEALNQGVEELSIKTWDLITKTKRMEHAFGFAFPKTYEEYFAIQKGYIHFKDNPLSAIYPKTLAGSVRNNIVNFSAALESFVQECGYAYQKVIDIGDWFSIKITDIKLGFDTTDPANPYKLKYIEVKPRGCDFKRIGATATEIESATEEAEASGDVAAQRDLADVKPLSARLTRFNKNSPNKINVLAYFAKLYDIDDDIQAPEMDPWTDIMERYTWPLIEISNEEALNEHKKTDVSCGVGKSLDLGNMFDNAIDFVEDLFALLAHELNKQACATRAERIALNPKNIDLGLLKYYRRDDLDEEDKSQFMKEYESKDSTSNADALGVDWGAMSDMAINRALKEINIDDTLLLLLADLYAGGVTSRMSGAKPDGEMLKKLRRISFCDMTKLFKKVLKCLLAGIPFDQAMKKIIEMVFKELSLRHIPKLLAMLPAEKQMEVSQKVATIIEGMPSPWSPGYKSGGVRNEKVSQQDVGITWTTGNVDGEDVGSATAAADQAEAQTQAQKDLEEYKAASAAADQEFDESGGGVSNPTRDAESAALAKYETSKNEAEKDAFKMEQGSLGKATQDITQLIIQAYVDAIIDSLGINELMAFMNRFPVSKILVTLLKTVLGYCPTQPLFHPSPFDFLQGFSFSVCDPTMGLKLPKLPKLHFGSILAFLKHKIKEIIIQMIVALIVKLIIKAIMLIEGILCKALEMLGRLAASPWTGESIGDMLRNLLKDYLCDDDDELEELMDEFLQASGVDVGALADAGVDPRQLSECFGLTVSSVATQDELLQLMSGREADPAICERMSAAIIAKCPELAEFFGSPEQVCNFFDSLRSYLPPGVALDIRNALDEGVEDRPTFTSICLTNDDFDKWNDLRNRLLQDHGMDPDDASDLIDKINEDALDSLEDILNIAGGNLDDMLANAMEDLLDEDPCNKFDPNDLKKGPIFPSSNSSAELQDSFKRISDFILNQIATSYDKEISSKRGGTADRILSDTQGKGYRMHKALRRFFLTKGFYYDSEEQAEIFEAGDTWQGFFDLIENHGYFPYTVGAACRDQIILSDAQYKTEKSVVPFKFGASIRSGHWWFREGLIYPVPSRLSPSISMTYESLAETENERVFKRTIDYAAATTTDEASLGFALVTDPLIGDGEELETINDAALENIWADLVEETETALKEGGPNPLDQYTNVTTTVDQSFDYSITIVETATQKDSVVESQVSSLNIRNAPDTNTQELIDTLTLASSSEIYRVKVLNSLINKHLAVVGIPSVSGSELFDKMFQGLFDYQKLLLVSNSEASLANLITLGEKVETAADTLDFANESSQGFLFGYETDDVTEEALEYVGPDGEEYEYKEDEKVLGRSATNHPRVHFLNPDIHGGRYTRPKIWIEPPQENGLLGAIKSLAPIEKKCNPQDTNLLNIAEIKSRTEHIKNNTSTDKRLFQERYCAKEIPFDRILDKDTHATLDGVIQSAIRVFVSESLFEAMPMLMTVQYDERNFNSYFADSVYEKMKADMLFQNAWFTRIEKRAYWYLFLEQCVQAFQRKIEVDGYEPEGAEAAALQRIKEVQIEYNYPDDAVVDDFQKFGEEMTFYSPGPDFQFSHENILSLVGGSTRDKKNKYLNYALLFMAFGDLIFQSKKKFSGVNVSFIDFFAARELRFASKVFTIRLVEEDCKFLMMKLINEQIDKSMEIFYKKVTPVIYDTKGYLLSKQEIFHGSKLKTGTGEYYKAIKANSLVDPGDVADIIHNPSEANPLDSSVEDTDFADRVALRGQFYLEKYISVYKEKPADDEQAPELVKDRDPLLTGKLNIEQFKILMSDIHATVENPDDIKLSDCFGDLEFIYPVPVYEFYKRGYSPADMLSYDYMFDEQSYEYIINGDDEKLEEHLKGHNIEITQADVPFDITDLLEDEKEPLEPINITGELGLNYGIRVCYIPPASMVESGVFSQSTLTTEDDIVKKEKTYRFLQAGEITSSGWSIPIAQAEYGLIDETLKDFLKDTETKNKVDMNCLVDLLSDSPEFKLVFDNCISMKSTNSMVMAYIMSNWIISIGENDGWVVDDVSLDPNDHFNFWDGKNFKDTKKILRRTFAGLYNNQKFTPSDEDGLDLWGWLKSLFSFEFKLNFSFLSIWLSRRLVDEDPFDADGEECGDQYAKLFK